MQTNPTFQIRRLSPDHLTDFQALVHLFNRVFEAEPNLASETGLLKLLHNPNFLVLVALVEDEVVGGLTAYELPLYTSDSSEMFIYDLAVNPPYQRMGIGRGLLDELKTYCRERGILEFFVMAHAEDEHAVEFYRATGGKSEDVVNFVYEAM